MVEGGKKVWYFADGYLPEPKKSDKMEIVVDRIHLRPENIDKEKTNIANCSIRFSSPA